jgi:hypothetical protein
MPQTVQKLETLARVKLLQTRLAADKALRRGRLQTAAFGLAALGLVFLALAGFWILSATIGQIGAAALIGGGAVAGALLCLWLSGRRKSDPQEALLAQMEQMVRQSLEADFAKVDTLVARLERGAAGSGALAEGLGLALSLLSALSPKSRVVAELLRAGLTRFGKR